MPHIFSPNPSCFYFFLSPRLTFLKRPFPSFYQQDTSFSFILSTCPEHNLSKTFWKPQFPANRPNVVRREHPIPRWGDYSPTTGIYLWQKERFSGGVSSAHISRIETALAGLWYGVENHPRCNHCERADRSCTMVINDVHGTMACARCRLNPDLGCSFANFGKTTPSTAACQQSAGLSSAIRQDLMRSDDQRTAETMMKPRKIQTMNLLQSAGKGPSQTTEADEQVENRIANRPRAKTDTSAQDGGSLLKMIRMMRSPPRRP
jgi:hypothetical protein